MIESDSASHTRGRALRGFCSETHTLSHLTRCSANRLKARTDSTLYQPLCGGAQAIVVRSWPSEGPTDPTGTSITLFMDPKKCNSWYSIWAQSTGGEPVAQHTLAPPFTGALDSRNLYR